MIKKTAYAGAVSGSFFLWFFFQLPAFAFSPKVTLAPITPNIHSLPEFIMTVLKIVVQIGIPVAAFFIIWSGFLFVTAQGNESQLTKAKSAFVWAVVGTGVLLGAWLLATAIQGTIAQIGA
jgi:hypothetical protein